MPLTKKLTNIADAIRAKTGKSVKLTLDQMPKEIAGINSGGANPTLQEKNITANGEYTADSGYDGLRKVNVNVPVPNGYVIPTGTKSITANGTHSVSGFANAEVNVPNVIPDGYIKPSGTKSISTNGAHDVTQFAVVNVNVPTEGGGTCSGEHIIPVDELPTENIDDSAVYKCGDAYYKRANELVDIIVNGSSFAEMRDTYGVDVRFFKIPTEITDGVVAFEEPPYAFYYIEDENDVLVYNDGWNRLSDIGMGAYNGVIADESEATSSEGYYAVMKLGWTKYLAPSGELTVTESGTYDVSDVKTAAVDIRDAAVCGVWRFNDTIDPVVADDVELFQMVNFTSADSKGVETAYYGFSMAYESYISKELSYITSPDVSGGAMVNAAWDGESWQNEGQKVIDFGTDPQMVYSAFKEWLVANATPIYEIVRTDA